MNQWLLWVIYALMIILPLVVAVAYLTTLVERKIIGYMQLRTGPNRVGFAGILQPIVDAIKFVTKELVFPTNADWRSFILAPQLMLVPSLTVWAVVPFSSEWIFANIDAGVLFVFAMTSLLSACWGIDLRMGIKFKVCNVRECNALLVQIISYEIAMVALVGVLMLSNSLNLKTIVLAQTGGLLNWYWLPLLPLFLVPDLCCCRDQL